MAESIATLSKARRNKVGCVLVTPENVMLASFNGTPSGWDNNCEYEEVTDDPHFEPVTFLVSKPTVIHAELNAMVSNLDSKLKDANLKAKSLTAYQHATITKELHDTIMLHDTVVSGVSAKRGSYHINCVDLTFLVSQDTAIFGYTSYDTVDVYISTEKEGKWWQIWKFPRKKTP